MSEARSHHRSIESRDIRAAKMGNARDAIGTLTPRCEIYVLTYGQFSLTHALTAILEQTGPADVVLGTWTAAHADLSEVHALIRSDAIRDFRIIIDSNMLRRPNAAKLVADIRGRFGEGGVRTTAMHAKFATIQNDDWTLALRTSMNLNQNPRMENIEISDDPDLCRFLTTVADDLFREQGPGLFDADLPELASVPNVERSGVVSMGHASAAPPPKVGH